jgi:hypothetical protein
MSDLTIHTPPRFEGFTNEQMIGLCSTMLTKWTELIVKEMKDDIARMDTLEVFDQAYLRAKWLKTIDMILAAHDAVQKYDTPEGKLDLIIQQFGDKLGMPAHSLAEDIKRRMDWYKQRVAGTFEQSIKGDLNRHDITSPRRTNLSHEMAVLEIDQKHAVTIRPQTQLTIAGAVYRIDLPSAGPAKNISWLSRSTATNSTRKRRPKPPMTALGKDQLSGKATQSCALPALRCFRTRVNA